MSQTPFTTEFESPRRSRVFSIVLTVGVVLVMAFFALSGFITDRMWFESVDQTGVFDSILITKVILFVASALIAGGFAAVNVWIAYRSRPAYQTLADIPGLQDNVAALQTFRRIGLIGGPLIIAFLVGTTWTEQWQPWMQFMNAKPFGDTDPTFGMDISYFMFELPFLQSVQASLSAIVVMTGLLIAAVHYFIGSLRSAPRTMTGRLAFEISDTARRQIAVLGGLFLLLQAWGQYLDRFALALNDTGLITGLTFVGENVNLPALNILAGISVVCALLFFFNVFRSNWTLPILGLVLMFISSIALSGIWPSFVQQVQVRPDEQAKESPYIAKNIESTRKAYGLDKVVYQNYNAVEVPNAEILDGDAATLRNIRLLDPVIVARTVEQLQQLKGFYSFATTLDISRYNLNGETRGTVLAVREVNLDGIPETQRNWVTNTLIYTHGIGLVAAYDNQATADGQPDFIESDVPPNGLLNIEQPRVYFGENSPVYSIVGGEPIELDYPDDTAPSGQQNTSYEGAGGVSVGSTLNKLLFAARFGEINIMLSEQVTPSSRILYNRTPTERVQAIAPWLTLDGDPYPAVIDGRIVWIVDGYTTSAQYPYSQKTAIDAAVTDSTGARNSSVGQINYIRNSVKATVDAYDGTVTLYAWDEQDPILQTWRSAFPDLVQDKSAMSDALLQQVRYPEDLFKVQRDILRKYHITDPGAFFTGENFWIIPDDPASSVGLPQPPYYLNLRMPGDDKAAFMLTTTFAPAKRPSLAAFVAVDSDPGENYGRIRLLQLPSQTTIPGPVQANNIFESDAAISSQLSLLRRGGSDVVLGNLLSLPVGGGILYVQPVYVQSTGAGAFPLLRKVMVGFGQKVVLADTVSEALNKVLGTSTDPDEPDNPNEPVQTAREKLIAALAAAQKAYEDGQAALAEGDFAAYGAAQRRLAAAIDQAEVAASQLEAAQQ